MRDSIYADLADLRARRQLLSATLQENLTTAAPDSAMEDRARLAAIEHLDAFEFPHRVRDTHRSIFLAPTASHSLTWPEALPLFFTYAITPSRPCSGHRRYLVAQLIWMERERLQSGKKRVTRSAALLADPSTLPGAELRVEDAFVRWIDTLDPDLAEKHDVRLLAEELFRAGVMNYGAYLQRMIARGETERDLDSDGESNHLWVLRTVPLDPSLAEVKRRVAVSDKAPAKPTRAVDFFTYAITPSRPCSGHRRYLVAQLIWMERERLQSGKKRVTRSAALLADPSTLPGAELRVEDAFVRWIDTLDPDLAEKHDVRLLAEELFRAGVMNYGAYLQRMIARGETERDLDSDGESNHLWVLRTVPLDPSLAEVKRRVAVSDKAPAKPTRAVEPKLAQARHDVEQLFGAAAVPDLLGSVRQLVGDGSQWAVTRDILPTAVSGRIDRATGRLNISRDVLAVTCQVYQSVKDWAGLLQVSDMHARCPS